MKWLKSTSQKTWYANGKLIPACVTPNNNYLQLDEDEYTSIASLPVIASLIKAGGILVLDQEPAELKNSVEGLKGTNASLVARNKQLEERIKELEASTSAPAEIDVDKIKEEAVAELRDEAIKEIQSKDDEIAELKRQLKAAKKAANKESAE